MTPTHTLIETTRDEFKNRFGVAPTWVAAAPGRINLIGEHTDYNDGFVLPLAIERYTVVVAAPSTSGLSSVYSMNKEELANVIVDKISDPPTKVTWDSYVQGTISCCREAGVVVNPFNAVINTDVPIGSSLSSSAALEISVATLIEEMSGKKFDPVAKALTCQRAEHIYAKMPCGIMDQFISAMGVDGSVMLLDCRSKKTRMVPLSDTNVAILAINSNVKHELTGSEYPERRRQCEEAAKAFGVKMLRDVSLFQLERQKKSLDSLTYRRARHVITENMRTVNMADLLAQSEWETCGRLMYASHESMRDDFEISCPEIDDLVDIAKSLGINEGVYGSRMTGGGFGGCTVSLVQATRATQIGDAVAEQYKKKTGIEASYFITRPARGAMVVK